MKVEGDKSGTWRAWKWISSWDVGRDSKGLWEVVPRRDLDRIVVIIWSIRSSSLEICAAVLAPDACEAVLGGWETFAVLKAIVIKFECDCQ